METVVLLGPPGAGKGTIAERIAAKAGYCHLSTGDMLRQAVKESSGLGRQAKEYMEKGELVPDDLMVGLVEERFRAGNAADRYLLDGFPRTIRQAELLEKGLRAGGGLVSAVIFMDTPRDVLVQRLAGRRTCRQCGWNCHVVNLPPKVSGVCDMCGGELYQRPDDREETVLRRLEVYQSETAGLKAYYERKDLLVRVDSSGNAEEVAAEILGAIEQRAGAAGKR